MTQATPHPTPSGDGDLRAKINGLWQEIASELMERWETGTGSFDFAPYTDKALQLIAQECAARERAARVDELEMIDPIASHKLAATVSDRIAKPTQAQGGQPT